jgi:hypothetical protein
VANPSRLCVALLLISLVAAGAIASRRMRVERHNRGVQIVLEWSEVRTLAYAVSAHTGRYDPAALLRRLRQSNGVGGLAVTEMSLAELVDSGRAFLERDRAAAGPARGTRLVVPEHDLAAQIVAHVNAKRGPGRARLLLPRGGGPAVVLLRDGYELVRGTGIGFPPEALRVARAAGVEVIGRLGNYVGITPAAIDWSLAQVAAAGVRTVVFVGIDVLGNKGLLQDTAEALQRHQLNFGFVEFGKQQGDAALARLMRGRVVRVHSITDAEMNQLTPPEAADRFVKAARERDIRLLYVRLFLKPAEDPVLENGRYLDAIGRGLQRVGLVIGRANPFDALYTGRPLLILTGMGVVAGTVLLLSLLLCLPARVLTALLLLGAAGSAALLGFDPTLNLARKLLALVAALVFPTLALLRWGDPLRGADEREGATAYSPTPSLLRVVCAFLAMSATTLAGALLVVGLLGDTRFLLKYDQFVGIKVAHLLPLLALAAVLAAGALVPASSWPDRWRQVRGNLRSLAAEPVLVWQIAALALALLVVLVLVLRTGNDPGMGVSSLELKLRALMDRFLFVRPRTKEFLIGHPAMVVALWAGLKRWRLLWAPALLLGAVGQVSLLNTFCHIHTPLALSLLRAANGLGLGLLLGGVAVLLIRHLLPGATGAMLGSKAS